MQAHLEAQREEVWDHVGNNMFIPISVVNDVSTIKIKISWNEDDNKKLSMTRKQRIFFK